jgi:hypothetical protein
MLTYVLITRHSRSLPTLHVHSRRASVPLSSTTTFATPSTTTVMSRTSLSLVVHSPTRPRSTRSLRLLVLHFLGVLSRVHPDGLTIQLPYAPVYFAGAQYSLQTLLTYPVNGSDGKPVYIIGQSSDVPLTITPNNS